MVEDTQKWCKINDASICILEADPAMYTFKISNK